MRLLLENPKTKTSASAAGVQRHQANLEAEEVVRAWACGQDKPTGPQDPSELFSWPGGEDRQHTVQALVMEREVEGVPHGKGNARVVAPRGEADSKRRYVEPIAQGCHPPIKQLLEPAESRLI